METLAKAPRAPLVELKNLKAHLRVREGVVKAVDGATFDIRRGETLGIVGESGCGKSMTARSILRIAATKDHELEGEILYHRRETRSAGETERSEVIDLAKLDPRGEDIRRIRGAEIAMIFQEPMTSFSPVHTIGNQIIEAIRLHRPVGKKEAKELAVKALQRVHLSLPERRIDQYPHELSGGMRQRAMIAMALSCEPQLLLADEPTTALDVTTQAQILALMRELKEQSGMSIVMITHDLGVIAETAQRVVVMYLGKVVETADVRTLFRDPKHPYTRSLLQSLPKMTRHHRERLQPVKGMVPSPFSRPQGCPFHTRCPEFMPGTCDQLEPTPVHLGVDREVSCFLYGGKEGT